MKCDLHLHLAWCQRTKERTRLASCPQKSHILGYDTQNECFPRGQRDLMARVIWKVLWMTAPILEDLMYYNDAGERCLLAPSLAVSLLSVQTEFSDLGLKGKGGRERGSRFGDVWRRELHVERNCHRYVYGLLFYSDTSLPTITTTLLHSLPKRPVANS